MGSRRAHTGEQTHTHTGGAGVHTGGASVHMQGKQTSLIHSDKYIKISSSIN